MGDIGLSCSGVGNSLDNCYSLKWKDFHTSILNSLRHLREEEDFVDVTLSCDGRAFSAHKIVLSACSPYFRGLFKANPCQHPIIILRDTKTHDIEALLEFMYDGEVNVNVENLTDFLKTAQVLQIRGLSNASEKDPVVSSKEKTNSTPSLEQSARTLRNTRNKKQNLPKKAGASKDRKKKSVTESIKPSGMDTLNQEPSMTSNSLPEPVPTSVNNVDTLEYAFVPHNVATESQQPYRRRTSPRVKVEVPDNSYGESFANGSVTNNCSNVYIKEEMVGVFMNEDGLSRMNWHQPLSKPIVLIKDVTTIDDDTLQEEITKKITKSEVFTVDSGDDEPKVLETPHKVVIRTRERKYGRPKMVLSVQQEQYLEAAFQKLRNPDRNIVLEMSSQTNLSANYILTWFRNRRNKSIKQNILSGNEKPSITVARTYRRMTMSPRQLKILKTALQEDPGLDAVRRQKIAKKANISETRVRVWFGNNRKKMRVNKILTKRKTGVVPQRGAKPNRPTQRNKALKPFRFSRINRQKLENSFNENQYPNAAKVQEFADLMNVTQEKIQVWFKNRRSQWKKDINKALF